MRSSSRISAAAFGMFVPGPKTARDARLAQEVVVLRRDHAAADDEDVVATLLAQLRDQLGHERLVPGGLARHADDVHVVLDRVARRLLGRLEQRADVDVEAEVGERGGDHLGAAVVAVLAHLHDEHARAAALGVGELVDLAPDLLVALVALVRRAVHAGDATDRRRGGGRTPSPARRRSRRRSRGRASPRWRARAGCRRPAAPSVSRSSAACVAASSRVARMLLRAGRPAARAPRCCRCRGCRSAARRSSWYLLTPTIDLLAAVDARLAAGRGFLDAQLRHARLDGLGHAAELLDLLDELPRLRGERCA